jgi:hypothetical protein
MLYLLKKVSVNGNADMYGGRDTETEIAISQSISSLQDYCREKYGKEYSRLALDTQREKPESR